MFVDKLIDGEKKNVSFARREDADAFLLGIPLSLVCNVSSLEVKIGEKRTSADIRCRVKISSPVKVNINNGEVRVLDGRIRGNV